MGLCNSIQLTLIQSRNSGVNKIYFIRDRILIFFPPSSFTVPLGENIEFSGGICPPTLVTLFNRKMQYYFSNLRERFINSSVEIVHKLSKIYRSTILIHGLFSVPEDRVERHIFDHHFGYSL